LEKRSYLITSLAFYLEHKFSATQQQVWMIYPYPTGIGHSWKDISYYLDSIFFSEVADHVNVCK